MQINIAEEHMAELVSSPTPNMKMLPEKGMRKSLTREVGDLLEARKRKESTRTRRMDNLAHDICVKDDHDLMDSAARLEMKWERIDSPRDKSITLPSYNVTWPYRRYTGKH
jgi:hypothetical protein